MNKVKLQLDALQVESFAVQAEPPGPGTVMGLQGDPYSGRSECSQAPTVCLPCLSWPPSNCSEPSCAGSYPTCCISCFYTECATCPPTCDPTLCVARDGAA